MTEAQSTQREITKILLSDCPWKTQMAWYELMRHHDKFTSLLNNIKATSISPQDEQERIEAACAEYGYRTGDHLMIGNK